MTTLTTDFIAQTLGLAPVVANRHVHHIVIDSREVKEGDVFIAIAGNHVDGHDFVTDALARKAALCLVDREDLATHQGCLKVDNTVTALGQLAHAWRQQFSDLTIMAITGSCGKTTVKDVAFVCLRQAYGEQAILGTAGNLNNHLGVPLTLLRLRDSHRFAVIEMGMNHAGELQKLSQMVMPDIALINNAMRAHLGGGFNDVHDIALAKCEILDGLKDQGTAVLPAQDNEAETFYAALKFDTQLQTFGIDFGDDFASDIHITPEGSHFLLHHHAQSIRIHTSLLGRHNIHNILAAASLVMVAGVGLEDIAQAIAMVQPRQGRLNRLLSTQGSLILNDSYNANPDAVYAAIDALAMQPNRPRILVLGAMKELGEKSTQLHAEVGAYALSKNIETAFFYGDEAQSAAQAFDGSKAWQDKKALIQALRQHDQSGAVFLIKGSHSTAMDEIVNALTADNPN